jgi:hypothetical protein
MAGVGMLIVSRIYSSSLSAFIGLGLVLWGILFLSTKPSNFVQRRILMMTVSPSYQTVERIMGDLGCSGKGFYIPSLPKEIPAPEFLAGLSDTVVFMPSEPSNRMPSLNELAEKKFLNRDPKGITVVPPGIELLTILKKKLERELGGTEPTDLCTIIPKVVIEDMQMAKEMELNFQRDKLFVSLNESFFNELYSQKEVYQSVHSMGCPIMSMLSCAFAESLRKIVTIDQIDVSQDRRSIDIVLSLL